MLHLGRLQCWVGWRRGGFISLVSWGAACKNSEVLADDDMNILTLSGGLRYSGGFCHHQMSSGGGRYVRNPSSQKSQKSEGVSGVAFTPSSAASSFSLMKCCSGTSLSQARITCRGLQNLPSSIISDNSSTQSKPPPIHINCSKNGRPTRAWSDSNPRSTGPISSASHRCYLKEPKALNLRHQV